MWRWGAFYALNSTNHLTDPKYSPANHSQTKGRSCVDEDGTCLIEFNKGT